jgi:general secretion pathway protein I
VSRRRVNEEGFTLIEVVVALAILAVSLGALLRILSTSLVTANETEAEVVANSLLQSMLDRLGGDLPLVAGDTTGQFTNGFGWHLHITSYGSAEDQEAWSVKAYQVNAEVDWIGNGRLRSQSLTTLRLAPNAKAQ